MRYAFEVRARTILFLLAPSVASFALTACSSSETEAGSADAAAFPSGSDASPEDAATAPIDSAAIDAAIPDSGPDGGCFVSTVGTFGMCTTTADCQALGDHVSTPGYCPGPASIECCSPKPNVADNPPIPAGWKLMAQADVTPEMTTWAVFILNHPTTYPMFATTTQMFGVLDVLARVEWHPPDFQNAVVHRGVTLYEPN
jgi:hypothetical protein